MKKRYTILKTVLSFVLVLAMVLPGMSPVGTFLVQAETATEENLILYYDFDLQNSYATQINDVSGHSNAGNLKRVGGGAVEGNYSINAVNLYGKTVKALKLNGGSDGVYLKLPDGILDGKDEVTISVWVNLSTDTGYQRIWDFGNDMTSYMYLLSDGANPGFTGYASAITMNGWDNEQGVQKETNIDKNRWVLTTVVMNDTTMSLYENGRLVGTKDTGIKVSELGATTGNYIGYGQFGDAPTAGQFAEVKIYDKAMTAEEVAAMYTVDGAGIVSADVSVLDLGELSSVTEDITLPTVGVNGSVITWTSENAAIVIENGTAKVTRPAKGAENVSGKLIATVTYNGVSDTKQFDVTVLAEYSDEYIVQSDWEAAQKALGDLSVVMADITLPVTGNLGSTITWTSTNPAVTVDGAVAKVTRPAQGEENATGKLTATVKYGTAELKDVSVNITVLALREIAVITKVEEVNVTTLTGHSPSLPNYVKVTYSDGTTNKLKAVWPDYIDEASYAAEGTFKAEGRIVGYDSTKLIANVTVTDAENVAKTVISSNFDLSDITLDGDGTILTENRDRDITYLKLLNKDRMLYNFYKTFGQTDKIANISPLGGWDEPSGLLRGHSTGHYMSALALAYASTGDEEIKSNLDYVIHELREMQKLASGDPAAFTSAGVDQSVWSTDMSTWGTGFLSAYSPDQFALLEKYTPYAQIWAPYYTLHKLMAGLLDAYTYTGNEEALETAEALGEWVYARLSACSQEQLTTMWDMYIAGEFGGFNESLAKLYIYTDNEDFLKAAKLFDNTNFFNKLKINVDDIAGRHANQHIPQIIGAMEIYEATVKKGTPEAAYYDIAENFWQMTVSRYAYSIGGVGTGEKFTQPYQQANHISSDENCETCAAYNMLKLTMMLNNYAPDDAEYMDYYERTLYNQILASQTPNVTANMHNGTTYMLPIGPGVTRSFGSDYGSFSCCHGTGMENHVKYQEAAYVKTADELYVGLYLPSTVTWEEKGVKVVQETAFPSETTKLTVKALDSATAEAFDMKLRVPYWATNGFEVKVNGEVVTTNPEISSYITLEDVKVNDVIDIYMPWTLHLDKTPDKIGNTEVASVMYGPYVMAAQINDTNWKTLVLSANLSDSIQVSTDEETGLPNLTANGYNFAPMFAAEYATEAYHAYFKVLTADDDGSKWYEAKITNTTPKFGTFTIGADMVKEGASLVITAAPNEGYMVKMLTVNGESVTIGEDNTYTVENVSSDLVIEGSFRLINPPTPDPAHLEYTATVTSDYTSSWENLEGIMADWEPTTSAPGIGLGWGNWSQAAGSEHYVQYSWDTDVTINKFEIYWYDDNGGTRVPASIKVMYMDEKGTWKEAEMLSKYEDVVAINKYNTLDLTAFTTTAVKLVLTVRSDAAAHGILRWKVSGPTEEEVKKEALDTTIQAVESKVEADYTADSWKAFKDALDNAKEISANPNATAEELAEAQTALTEAEKALVKVSENNPTDTPANPTDTPTNPTDMPTNPISPTVPATVPTSPTQEIKPGSIVGVGLHYYAVGKGNTVSYLRPDNPNTKTVTIPATVKISGKTYKVTKIAGNAFGGCKKLKKVVIGANVSSIGAKAFAGCKKTLTSITIGKNIKTISASMFKSFKNLKTVVIKSTKLTKVGKNAFKGIQKKATIKVPKKVYKKYKKMLTKSKVAKTVKIKKA